jgi:proteasome beta subunit
MRHGENISIDSASALASNILQSSPLFVQTLLGGVDEEGASIYSLDPAGGMIKDSFISTGSGSTFSYGVLEDRVKDDVTVKKGVDIAIRAIRAAIERDTFSGNGVLVATVTKDNGFEMLPDDLVEKKIKKIN